MAEEASDEMKVCPRCAESVKQEAEICRYCRFDFAKDNKRADPKRKNRIKALSLILTIFFIVGIVIYAKESYESSQREMQRILNLHGGHG